MPHFSVSMISIGYENSLLTSDDASVALKKKAKEVGQDMADLLNQAADIVKGKD